MQVSVCVFVALLIPWCCTLGYYENTRKQQRQRQSSATTLRGSASWHEIPKKESKKEDNKSNSKTGRSIRIKRERDRGREREGTR